MSQVVSCLEGIHLCKPLIEEVQILLGPKRMSMEQIVENSRRTIAEEFRFDIQDALKHARLSIEVEWGIRAVDLIKNCCDDINNNRSDNGESSQILVDNAVSSLVHLAREFPHFHELCNLGKRLEELCGERPKSEEFRKLLSDFSGPDSEREKEYVRKIAYEQRWNPASGMVYVKMKFDKYRIILQTLLFISEVISYGLNLTAENNIIILVPVLVLSATCFLFINIPLIRRCCRKRTVRVVSRIEWGGSAFSEWVESSFSIFQLVADILKVAGHAESSSKVTETWVLVFAAIGYFFFLIKRNTDGERIRRWIRRMIMKIRRRYRLNDPCILEDPLEV